ncbi:MAG: zinc-binding dehydrogenase, partial [Oscillochloris sp.]|nr:zinc-binding dehydrogenase [Oscillochloris sp.]
RRNYGKSAALNRGFEAANGDVVITMDADLQDSPDEIPELFRMVAIEGFDVVSGWKKKRHDPISKTIPTKLYNWATRRMTGIKLHDFNCGLKAYKREVVKSIEVYGEMHRYIPVMAKCRIGHFVEAQILEAIGVDYIDESEVLTPADEAHHINKHGFKVPFVCGCGDCPQCASGNHQVCDHQFQPGFTHWGSFAEYVAIQRADINLVALPDTVDDVTAASLGCRFATSFRAVVDQGRASAGQWVVVHGCGGVGLSAIMIATALGARVVAVDIADDKLAFARDLGATATVHAAESPDLVQEIVDITNGGAHLSLDALGSPDTCFASISCLRKRGRHVQVGLMLAEQSRPAIPMDKVIAHELEILGSHGMQAYRYDAMLAMIQAGTLRPDRLVGRTIALTEVPTALPAMNSFIGTGVTVIDRL